MPKDAVNTDTVFFLLTNQVWRQVVSPFRGAETSSRARGLFRLATFVLKQNGNKLHDGNKQHGNKINRCQIVHLGAEKEKEEKTSSCRQHCHPGRSLILQLFCDNSSFGSRLSNLTIAYDHKCKKKLSMIILLSKFGCQQGEVFFGLNNKHGHHSHHCLCTWH